MEEGYEEVAYLDFLDSLWAKPKKVTPSASHTTPIPKSFAFPNVATTAARQNRTPVVNKRVLFFMFIGKSPFFQELCHEQYDLNPF